MNAQAMWSNERPQNERTNAVNERTNKITHERTHKPDNRTSEMPAKQTENGLITRTNACKPGNSTNGWIHLVSLFKTNRRSASLVHNIEKYFWAALNKISRNWFDNAIEKKKKNRKWKIKCVLTFYNYFSELTKTVSIMTCLDVTVTSQIRHVEFEAAILNPKPAVIQLTITSPKTIWFGSKKHT